MAEFRIRANEVLGQLKGIGVIKRWGYSDN